MEETLEFPEWVTQHFFRPENTAVNLNRMRKEATNKSLRGQAVIHHHGADSHCGPSRQHEYFGFGPHSKCDGEGCSGCDLGWKKHG